MKSLAPFAILFRKYRLRSEFETMGEFGDALADMNLIYENSIFSHWQKGTRTPKDRNVVLAIIKIFAHRRGITTVQEANEIMASTGLGYLTDNELSRLSLVSERIIPFQAPRLSDTLIGRSELKRTLKQLVTAGKIIFLTGQPGVGKTALAIETAHRVRDQFPDGVIWCNCSNGSVLNVLNSIALAFGEILPLTVTENEATLLYRSFVSTKKALFIFDSVPSDFPIESVLPNSSQSGVLITSTFKDQMHSTLGILLEVESLSDKEVLEFYSSILSDAILKSCANELKVLGKEVGNLPLALTILCKQIAYNGLSPNRALSLLEDSQFVLSPVYASFSVCYSQLDHQTRKFLLACQYFGTGSFSLVAAQTITESDSAVPPIQTLLRFSLIKEISANRYSLHPLLIKFLDQEKSDPTIVEGLARYYISFIALNQNKTRFFSIMAPEVECISHILHLCIRYSHVDLACELWQ